MEKAEINREARVNEYIKAENSELAQVLTEYYIAFPVLPNNSAARVYDVL